MRQGHFRRAVRSFQRSLAAGAFADSPVGFAFVALHLGYALALDNGADEGIPILEDSIRVAETRGFAARHSLRLAYVSEAYLSVNRVDDALSAASRALELARSHQERANEAYALRVLGEIDLRRGQPAEAESHFNAALQVATEFGLRPLEAHCYRALGEVFEAKRRADDATAFRQKADALAHAMGMRFWGTSLVESKAAE